MSNVELRLFSGQPINITISELRKKVINELNELSADVLLNANLDDVANQFIDKYTIHIPVFSENNVTRSNPKDISRVRHNIYGEQYWEVGTECSFFVKFEGDRGAFSCRPTRFSSYQPQAVISSNEFCLTYFRQPSSYANREAEGFSMSSKADLDHIKSHLAQLAEDTKEFNVQLPTLVKQQLDHRFRKYSKDREIGEQLPYPLRKSEEVPTVIQFPIEPKPLPIVSTAPPKQSSSVNLLAEQHYEQILGTIADMALVMERSPNAFKEMDEESIRWLFLVALNAHYKGAATGETFNYEGKTDILIRVENKNIFIAECKFWQGRKSFIATIDQILGYTSWRDTKTAIIIFSRNKNFSPVLKQIPEIAKSHSNFVEELEAKAETTFRYIFYHRDDPDRKLHLTVLSFHIPT